MIIVIISDTTSYEDFYCLQTPANDLYITKITIVYELQLWSLKTKIFHNFLTKYVLIFY